MNYHAFALVLIALVSSPLAVRAAPVQILAGDTLETYHGEDVADVKNGQEWFAIIAADEKYIAKKQRVSVETVFDEIVDAPNKPTGKKLTFQPASVNVAFYVRGLSLSDGQKITASPSPINLANPAELSPNSPIQLGDVTLVATAITTAEDDQPVQPRYVLTATTAHAEQTLLALDVLDDNTPKLLWAGDLNKDGHTDLLIDTSGHYNKREPTLFVTSQQAGQLRYRSIATRTTLGC